MEPLWPFKLSSLLPSVAGWVVWPTVGQNCLRIHFVSTFGRWSMFSKHIDVSVGFLELPVYPRASWPISSRLLWKPRSPWAWMRLVLCCLTYNSSAFGLLSFCRCSSFIYHEIFYTNHFFPLKETKSKTKDVAGRSIGKQFDCCPKTKFMELCLFMRSIGRKWEKNLGTDKIRSSRASAKPQDHRLVALAQFWSPSDKFWYFSHTHLPLLYVSGKRKMPCLLGLISLIDCINALQCQINLKPKLCKTDLEN